MVTQFDMVANFMKSLDDLLPNLGPIIFGPLPMLELLLILVGISLLTFIYCCTSSPDHKLTLYYIGVRVALLSSRQLKSGRDHRVRRSSSSNGGG